MTSSQIGYILGPLYASVPKRWRFAEHQSSPQFGARCAIVSGLVEAALALVLVRLWYMQFVGLFGNAYAQSVLDDTHNLSIAPEIVGGAGWIVFATNPLTWLLLYFALEGMLRMTAAAVTGEAYGVLPLYALDFGCKLILRRMPRREAPLVRDEVLPGDAKCDIRIASCRQRRDWKYPFTIRHNGAFFQVIGAARNGRGARPYVYSLRRLPPGEIARGLRNYDPEDILYEAPRITPGG